MKLSFRHRDLTTFDATAVAIEASGLSSSSRGHSSGVTVVHLDLSHNAIHNFTGGRALPQLTEFNIAHNLLRSVQNFPVNVVKLDVSHNKLESLAGIALLAQLLSLDCAHNHIQHIEANLLPCSLQSIVLSHNRIQDALGLSHLHKLLKVHLDHNDIAAVAGVVCLSGLKALRHITLEGNPVCSSTKLLPSLTACIPKLTTLDGMVLSQAQANMLFRAQQAARVKQTAAREHERLQEVASRRAAARQTAVDEAAEAEIRRLGARASELDRLVRIAAAEEQRLLRTSTLQQKQLRNVSDVLANQTEQLELSRLEIAKQGEVAEALRRTLASLDRTFKQQHAAIMAKKLEQRSGSAAKGQR
jgi:Leucine-rich repeat (LRR) protein